MKYVIGDATDPQGSDNYKIIAHVCNDAGGWGAGFTGALSRRWAAPELAFRSATLALGNVQFVETVVKRDPPTIVVANMVAQHGYRSMQNPVPLDYSVLGYTLAAVADYALAGWHPWVVHMPRIGCGLGNGDWDLVEAVIQDTLVARGVPVTVYDLP